MLLEGKKIGLGITGSFCTFAKVFPVVESLIKEGAKVIPILSEKSAETDTRFGNSSDFTKKIEELTGEKIISTIVAAEPVGPKNMIDLIMIAPCTGNTLAKLANAINDGPVLMSAKSLLRNLKPVVLGLSSNDALGMNAKNLGILLNTKSIYFIPFKQDDPIGKPNSLIYNPDLTIPSILSAFDGKQLQPLIDT